MQEVLDFHLSRFACYLIAQNKLEPTWIRDDVGRDRSLLICCSAFLGNARQFENLTIKKVPKAMLKKCEPPFRRA